MNDTLTSLLTELQAGRLEVPEVVERLTTGKTAVTADAQVDLDRQQRCGFPEVVFAEGKTSQAIVEIFQRQIAGGQDCLATRVTPDQAAVLREQFPESVYSELGRTVRIEVAEGKLQGRVTVVTAGTSDRPVAEETLETLRWMRCECELIVDVGVAGPHRLPEHLDRLRGVDAVVVIAGMEGALPSVVGGWVDSPVIAVPTSVGYGAALGGLAALLGMLNSCASNVAVVNIDAGFKAGYLAGLIARRRTS